MYPLTCSLKTLIPLAACVAVACSAVVSVDDLFKDCTKFDANLTRFTPEVAGDARMTPECLNSFNLMTTTAAAREAIRYKVLVKLTEKSWGEMCGGPVESFPISMPFLTRFFTSNNWKTNPCPAVVKMLVEKVDVFQKLLDDATLKTQSKAQLFTADTFKVIKDPYCSRITAELVGFMASNAFQNITSGCLVLIPADAFKGINEDFFPNINPLALNALKRDQADAIPAAAVKNMKPDQAKNWGMKAEIPVVKADTDPDKATQTAARRKYLDDHPCKTAQTWDKAVPAATQSELRNRCIAIWSLASALASPSVFVSLLMMILAGIVFTV